LTPAHPIEGLAELARKYGPIYELGVPGAGGERDDEIAMNHP
jgi:hypothetical protein